MEREGGDIRAEDMLQAPEEPGEIQKFYEGATVFVTGGTGFVGKILIEKLLRTCVGIRRIYVLLRLKKGKDPEQRFREIFDDILYNRLRIEQPDFENKLCIIPGDLLAPRLGIDDSDYQKLVSEVDIVLHVAATVRFDEKIRQATQINVTGTQEMLKLSRKMTNLRAFVHVSTAYSNCTQKEIEERVYDMPITGNKLRQIVDTLDDAQLEAITPLLLGEWPNTYVYTKAVAEEVVKTHGVDLPVAIVRPSIVISTAKEPVAGWIDNLYGATGIAVGAAVGLLRTLHCDPDNIADLVPVDYVANAIIAASWSASGSRGHGENQIQEPKDLTVFNYVGSTQAPISWREFMRLTELNAFKIPSPQTVWHYCFKLNPNWYVHMMAVYLLHFLPALVVDGGLYVCGKKPMLMKGYKKINKFANVLSYFSSRQWRFNNSNVQNLWKKLGPRDKEQFEFDMGSLSWDLFFYSYVRGMRVYLLKDPLDTVPQGRVKFWKLKIAHYFLVSLLLFGLFKLCCSVLTSVFSF